MKFIAPITFALSISASACKSGEAVMDYSGPDQVWTVTEIDGAPFDATATLSFLGEGRIGGKAPCNSFSAAMQAVYPEFKVGPIAATRMMCPDDAAEMAFFDALSAMTSAEVQDHTLVLSNGDGRSILFQSAD